MFPGIEFPEYQREPDVWTRDQKQRLIDSILRTFDIASIYFYKRSDDVLECIDGRQRLNAIMAFVNENHDDADNGFPFRVLNEISAATGSPFEVLSGRTYAEIEALSTEQDGPARIIARSVIDSLESYRITAVFLSDVDAPEEFNLQFLRLNLGTLINAGEKLNAMAGDMRDELFESDGIGQHPFFEGVRIPTRRFSKEQVAAQVLLQVFSWGESKDFTRARHFDLQRFLKTHAKIEEPGRALVGQVRETLDALDGVGLAAALRNRAITVSVVLLAWQRKLYEQLDQLQLYRAFIEAFLAKLLRQVDNLKRFQPDERYGYLVEFQRHVTQASVEKPAVSKRHEELARGFDYWLENGLLIGDREASEGTSERRP